MAITEDNALNNLNKFIMANQQLQPSPDKIVNMEDVMQKVLQEMPMFGGLNVVPPIDIKPTSSTDSDTPRNVSPVSDGQQDISSSTANKEPRYFDEMLSSHIMKAYRLEPWYECFTTISRSEFDALIYSVYVMSRDDKKVDGYEYYECINRLQSKCRYRVRTKRMNEFYIVEEKGAHNHAMEPVGTPGSHAGLPKTLREIVDKSFNEEWSHSQRQEKLEEEVRRLGLPHNPRLGRQVDNRIAYLRRVKNLNEMKKMQDQAPSTAISSGLSMVSNPKQMEQLDSQLKCEPEPIDSHQMNVSNATDLLNMVMQATGGQMSNSNPEEQLKLLQLMMGGAPLDLQPNCGSDNDTDLEMDAGRVENAKNLFIEGENDDDDDDDDDADDNGDDAEGAKGTASEINGSAMFGARDARVEIEERMDY